MTEITLSKISETTNTITLGWTPVAGCVGYVFYRNDIRVSNSWNPQQNSIKFSKGTSYKVKAVSVSAEGVYPSVAPPPPPPPPPTGSVSAKVDYSSPSPFGYTWGIQAGNYGFSDSAHAGSVFEAVLDPGGSGKKVAHCKLPSSSGGRAAEGLIKRNVDLGVTDFYGFSIYVPRGWNSIPQNPSWHTLSGQFNYSNVGDGGPPVSLCLNQTTMEVIVLSGIVSVDGNGVANGYEFQASPNVAGRLPIGSLPEATWVDLVFEIKWATDWTGHVNVWTRTGTNPYVQTVSKQSIPTQQHLAGQSPPAVTCDKSGLYAGPGGATEIYLSGFTRGSTFDVVSP